MPNSQARTNYIELTEAERSELVSMARSRSLPAGLALRARIVLACEGPDKASTATATSFDIDRNTVNKWRGRYARDRIAGLYDELRPGRPRTVDDEQVAVLINKTLHTTRRWSDALEYARSRERNWDQQIDGRALSQGVSIQATSSGELQALDRPFVYREAAQCRRAVFEPA